MKYYSDRLIKKVNKEQEEFKELTLSKSKESIYNQASKIRFYEYMNDYITFEDLDEETCKNLYKGSKNLLRELWDFMLDLEDFNIGNMDDADYLISEYADDCKKRTAQM